MVMMKELSLDDCDEKSEKKNDQDEVDGMRHNRKFIPNASRYNEISDQ